MSAPKSGHTPVARRMDKLSRRQVPFWSREVPRIVGTGVVVAELVLIAGLNGLFNAPARPECQTGCAPAANAAPTPRP